MSSREFNPVADSKRSLICNLTIFLRNPDDIPLREKCPYSELFWSAFSRIRTEYGEIRSAGEIRMQENAGQNNSEYGHFLRSVPFNEDS